MAEQHSPADEKGMCPECGSPYDRGCGARFHDSAPPAPEGFDPVEHARRLHQPEERDPLVGDESPDGGGVGDPPPPAPSSCPTCRVPNQDQRTAEEWAGVPCDDPWHTPSTARSTEEADR